MNPEKYFFNILYEPYTILGTKSTLISKSMFTEYVPKLLIYSLWAFLNGVLQVN
jgi:hypothetical protein